MKIIIILFTSALCALGQPTLNIHKVCLGTNNFVMQVAPHTTNISYYTLFASNNMLISGTADLTAYIDECIKLSWNTVTNQYYVLQTSTNLIDWASLRIRFEGTGSNIVWYDNIIAPQKFYRVAVDNGSNTFGLMYVTFIKPKPVAPLVKLGPPKPSVMVLELPPMPPMSSTFSERESTIVSQ